MAGGVLGGCTNLKECEDALARLVQPEELLSRIPLTAVEWRSLGDAFAKIISKYGDSEGSRKIWTSWPTCAAVYLVNAGIRLYRAGEFWPVFRENIGLSGNTTLYWGERFIYFLKKHQLPTFADTGGLTYITPILGHGGIPNYCLRDFFKYILTRAKAYTGLSGEDLLEELLNQSYITFADKPVQRFLANGGDYAADFLTRCLEMAQEVKKESIFNDVEQFGLPARIVTQYKEWLQEVAVTAEGSTDNFRSPYIKYDPYGLGVVAYLPGQRLNIWVSSIYWQIYRKRICPKNQVFSVAE